MPPIHSSFELDLQEETFPSLLSQSPKKSLRARKYAVLLRQLATVSCGSSLSSSITTLFTHQSKQNAGVPPTVSMRRAHEQPGLTRCVLNSCVRWFSCTSWMRAWMARACGLSCKHNVPNLFHNNTQVLCHVCDAVHGKAQVIIHRWFHYACECLTPERPKSITEDKPAAETLSLASASVIFQLILDFRVKVWGSDLSSAKSSEVLICLKLCPRGSTQGTELFIFLPLAC